MAEGVLPSDHKLSVQASFDLDASASPTEFGVMGREEVLPDQRDLQALTQMPADRHIQLGVSLHLLSREAPDVSEGRAQSQALGKIQRGTEVGHVARTRTLGRALGRGVKTVRSRGEI